MRLTTASLALVATCAVCGHAAVGEQNDESTRATLRGIRRVVLVISFQGDAALQRFEQAPIIRDVEQRLEMAGVSVMSLNQVVNGIASGEKAAAPADYLYVNANTVKSPIYPVYAASISIEVNRRVRLDAGEARAVTWEINRVFMFPSIILRDSLRNAIGDGLEEFVTAYVAANSR
ncbi:MAG: hypothetical protein DMG16_25355 [Acidobacteria bacterium]|nr:MAG: hypothetical protein DMG16_25355 [Acidobacteriota bacterium]